MAIIVFFEEKTEVTRHAFSGFGAEGTDSKG